MGICTPHQEGFPGRGGSRLFWGPGIPQDQEGSPLAGAAVMHTRWGGGRSVPCPRRPLPSRPGQERAFPGGRARGSGAPTPTPSEHGPRPWNGVILGASLPSSKEDLSKLWERAFPPQTRVGGGGSVSRRDVPGALSPSRTPARDTHRPSPEGWVGGQAWSAPPSPPDQAGAPPQSGAPRGPCWAMCIVSLQL